MRGLYAQTPEIRVRVAEALGNAQSDEFVEPLMDRLYVLAAAPKGGGAGRPPHAYVFIGTQTAYVQDFDVEVARSSSVADPVVNALTTGSVLDVGVINTSEVTIVAEARAVRGALQRIVGEAPGGGPRTGRAGGSPTPRPPIARRSPPSEPTRRPQRTADATGGSRREAPPPSSNGGVRAHRPTAAHHVRSRRDVAGCAPRRFGPGPWNRARASR